MRRFWGKLVYGSGLLIGLSAVAWAHDFWLVPDAFEIAERAELRVRGQTSSRFPTSESAVAPDRIAEARLIGATSDEPITGLSTSGTSLVLRHRPAHAGQRVVVASIAPRSLRAAGREFKRYMELEGAADLAAKYERQGLLPKSDSITRRYAKYAKTIVEVGRGGPRAYSRVAGQVAEFVPLRDPAALRAGDTLPIRLLYRGRPLGDAHVHAGPATDAEVASDLSLTTDADGTVRLPVASPGLWNIRTIHIVPAPSGSGADWDSHFVSFVFTVAAPATSQRNDSLAVVAVIDAFHAAHAAGDSAAALRMLTPDAVILESGGVETLAEYRAHHLAADIAFARALPSSRSVVKVTVAGDLAWVASTSTTRGEFRGRQINSTGAELATLRRSGGNWLITAIHWSSRTVRAP